MYGQALPYLGGSTSGQVHGDSFQAVTTTTANGFHPLALLPSTRLPTAQATQTITSRSWLEHRPLTRCHCRCPPFNGTWLYVTANPPFTLYFSGFADADTLASLNPQRIQRHIRMDRPPHATGCYLRMGSTGAGCDNLYNSAEKVVTRYTFTRVPLNGELNYVRLIANFKGVWTQNDYVYTAQ